MKRILVINAGQSQKNHVFKRLSELDYHITVLNPSILEDIRSYVDDWVLADLSDIQMCLQKITQQHHREKFDGILTFWEEDVLLTSEAAEILGLPGIDFSLAQNIRNKYEFRMLCQKKGVVTPKFLALDETISQQTIEEKMTFPCIVKPVYGACSAFVKKCYSSDEAYQYFQETIQSPEFKKEVELGNVKDLFLEGFISGAEVDIDILIQNGEIKYLSILDNFHGDSDYFIELGQISPSQFYPEQEKDLKKQSAEIIKKLGVQNGCLHFEAKIENGIVVPLELNMRMGGDEIWYSNKEVYGVDLVEQSVRISCGEELHDFTHISPKCRVYSEDILAQKAGNIKNIFVDATTLSQLGVIEYGVLKKVGEYIGKPPEDFSYLGWYMIRSPITEKPDYSINQERIKQCFQIEIE